VGLGSRLFEREVLRGVDPSPPPPGADLRYAVSFRCGNPAGWLELRDVFVGKALAQPSADVRHILHVRAVDGSMPRKRPLAEAEATAEQQALEGVVAVADTAAAVRSCGGEAASGGDQGLTAAGPGGYLVVCSSVEAAAAVAGGVTSGGAWAARPMLELLAEGWGGAVGFTLPRPRESRLCATGVQRLVGRALG
jgi:hypothetical protein